MADELELHCEHCGEVCADEWEIDVYHRGCRFKAAFPGSYTSDGGLLKFDMAKIREQLEGTPDPPEAGKEPLCLS